MKPDHQPIPLIVRGILSYTQSFAEASIALCAVNGLSTQSELNSGIVPLQTDLLTQTQSLSPQFRSPFRRRVALLAPEHEGRGCSGVPRPSPVFSAVMIASLAALSGDSSPAFRDSVPSLRNSGWSAAVANLVYFATNRNAIESPVTIISAPISAPMAASPSAAPREVGQGRARLGNSNLSIDGGVVGRLPGAIAQRDREQPLQPPAGLAYTASTTASARC